MLNKSKVRYNFQTPCNFKTGPYTICAQTFRDFSYVPHKMYPADCVQFTEEQNRTDFYFNAHTHKLIRIETVCPSDHRFPDAFKTFNAEKGHLCLTYQGSLAPNQDGVFYGFEKGKWVSKSPYADPIECYNKLPDEQKLMMQLQTVIAPFTHSNNNLAVINRHLAANLPIPKQ